jgi:hypothetical protein
MGLADTVRFPLLTTERYLNAQQAAREAVRKRLKDEEPKQDQFTSDTQSRFSPRFIKTVWSGLIATLIASFWISAGKQVAAAGLVFDPLPGEYPHLSEFWSQLSIIATLILSEVGAILFLVSAGTIAHTAPIATIWGRQVNVTQLVLRTFAFACAGYAILSNITITILHPQQQVAVVQWFISIVIPLIVLGLGILVERIVIEGMRVTAERKRLYDAAMYQYRAVVAEPDKHEYYPSVLMDAIYDEIMRYKKEREAIGAEVLYLVQSDQQYKVWMVQAEYQSHQQSNALLPDGANPFLLPASTPTIN